MSLPSVWGNSQPVFLQIVLLPHLLPPLFQDSNCVEVRPFPIVQVSLKAFCTYTVLPDTYTLILSKISADASRLLSSHPVLQYKHEWRSHGDRNRSSVYAQYHRLPLRKTYLATATPDRPTVQQQSLQCWVPSMVTIPSGDQSDTWWQVGYAGSFLFWKQQQFI